MDGLSRQSERAGIGASVPVLAALLLLCIGGGAASGLATPPGDWYASLAKPSWTPPGWLFGPVWTLLYAAMGVSAWMLWRRRSRPGARRALACFGAQLALNFAWTPVFFGLHRPGLAAVVILALLAMIAATMAASWRPCRAAAALMVPYLGWVGFASCLNIAIWLLNEGNPPGGPR